MLTKVLAAARRAPSAEPSPAGSKSSAEPSPAGARRKLTESNFAFFKITPRVGRYFFSVLRDAIEVQSGKKEKIIAEAPPVLQALLWRHYPADAAQAKTGAAL